MKRDKETKRFLKELKDSEKGTTKLKRLPEEYVLMFDDMKAEELRHQELKPKGFYKCIEHSDGYEEWSTPSGNPPSIFKGKEFDFGT